MKILPTYNLDKIKFATDSATLMHYYEGTWQTVTEDGIYKMLKSKILEVEKPGWEWFLEWHMIKGVAILD